ncbi:MAG: 30S ribosomal protein S3 [Nanoarchaeota archaeon]
MIERKFVEQRMKEFMIQEFVSTHLRRVGHSHTRVQRTPLGEKIIIFASRPGLVVGRKGQNIKKLTEQLRDSFNLENPQVEINEVENIFLDPHIIAERIADNMERFGSARFKGIGHKTMEEVMNAGALGVEILISGKLPGARAKRWRFYHGYLKKCGDIANEGVRSAYAAAQLKSGTVGVQVRVMPADIVLPDHIEFLAEKQEIIEPVKEPAKREEKKTERRRPAARKKAAPRTKKGETHEGKGDSGAQ